MEESRPFFSIIVAAYNAEASIAKTIESVLSQSFTDFEIVVKDACSSDSTLKQIPESDKIRVYSEKDKGIYDGMNAGIRYARGRFLTFLNCGDWFYDGEVLQNIYDRICETGNTGIVYGDYERDGFIKVQPSQMSSFTIYRSALCHQTMFFHRSVFDDCGLYKTQYRIKADYELTLAAFFAGKPFAHAAHTVCHYEGGGVSEQTMEVNEREHREIIAAYYSPWVKFRYQLILTLTLQKLRIYIMRSEKAPAWMKKLYRRLVNSINK